MMGDPFTAVLGTKRGVGRVEAVEPPTPIERARDFVRWANRQTSDDLLSYINAEREKTAELNVFLRPGYWRQDRDPAPSVDTIRSLTAVFDAGGTPIGFIEQLNDELRLLRYDSYAVAFGL